MRGELWSRSCKWQIELNGEKVWHFRSLGCSFERRGVGSTHVSHTHTESPVEIPQGHSECQKLCSQLQWWANECVSPDPFRWEASLWKCESFIENALHISMLSYSTATARTAGPVTWIVTTEISSISFIHSLLIGRCTADDRLKIGHKWFAFATSSSMDRRRLSIKRPTHCELHKNRGNIPPCESSTNWNHRFRAVDHFAHTKQWN